MKTFEDAFAGRTVTTRAMFERAKRTIPGGAGSTARLPRNGWKPYPLFMAEGNGSRLTDVDGNTYVDYLLGLGPMILGHRHPVVTAAVAQAINDLGTCFGLPYEVEIEAAEKVVAAVPGIEQVRFTNSGSEAVGTAVRLAQGDDRTAASSSGSKGITTGGRTRCTGRITSIRRWPDRPTTRGRSRWDPACPANSRARLKC